MSIRDGPGAGPGARRPHHDRPVVRAADGRVGVEVVAVGVERVAVVRRRRREREKVRKERGGEGVIKIGERGVNEMFPSDTQTHGI